MDMQELIKRKGLCCACGRRLRFSYHLNFLALNKKATWDFPIWDNISLKPEYPHVKRALAVTCDDCIAHNVMPTFAFYVHNGIIHRVRLKDLQNVYEIKDHMLTPPPFQSGLGVSP